MPLRGRNPGTLDRIISLRFPIITRDAIGGAVNGFGALANSWAGWVPAAGKEWFGADSKQSDGVDLFTIRYRADITTEWRLLFQGVLYEMVGQPIESGRRQYLDMPCRRLPDQSAGTLYATGQAFIIDLATDDDTKDIAFPNVFAQVPAGIMVQLLIPDGGFVFETAVVADSITAAGFTVDLSAAVPGDGYRLSIQAAL